MPPDVDKGPWRASPMSGLPVRCDGGQEPATLSPSHDVSQSLGVWPTGQDRDIGPMTTNVVFGKTKSFGPTLVVPTSVGLGRSHWTGTYGTGLDLFLVLDLSQCMVGSPRASSFCSDAGQLEHMTSTSNRGVTLAYNAEITKMPRHQSRHSRSAVGSDAVCTSTSSL